MTLPTNAQDRKERPITRGVLDYFPDALAAVAHVSFIGNQQHNPGEPMHWAREKSSDHADCIGRHLLERGTMDDDGLTHTAKLAWRALALLQIEIEEQADPMGILVDEMVRLMPKEASIELKRSCPVAPTFQGVPIQMVEKLGDPTPDTVQLSPGEVRVVDMETGNRTVYVAGPMRGYDFYNFPAFDEARERLEQNGWDVISPADIDREWGLDPINDPEGCKAKVEAWTMEDLRAVVQRDVAEILSLRKERGDAIAMLTGWEKSTGAIAEFFLARWCGLLVLDAKTGHLLYPYDVDYRAICGAIFKYLGNKEMIR